MSHVFQDWATIGRGSYLETKKKKLSKPVKKTVIGSYEPIEKEESCRELFNFDNYITSSLSRYGVGVKYALGKLGNTFLGTLFTLANVISKEQISQDELAIDLCIKVGFGMVMMIGNVVRMINSGESNKEEIQVLQR